MPQSTLQYHTLLTTSSCFLRTFQIFNLNTQGTMTSQYLSMPTIHIIGSTEGLPIKITATERNAKVSFEIFQPISIEPFIWVYKNQLRQLLGLLRGECHLFKMGTVNSSTFKSVMKEKKRNSLTCPI